MIRQIKYMTLLLLGLLCGSSAGAEDYIYTITDADEKTVKVQAGNKTMTEIAIPDEVEIEGVSYKVTEIATAGFSGCKNATSVVIGNNVTTINGNAFKECTGLQSVTIPASVTSIGSSVFNGCVKLKTANFSAAEELTELGNYMFQGCTKLNNVVLPPNLTALPTDFFNSCTALTTITLPASLNEIKSKAFYGCSLLANIVCEAAAAPTIRTDAFTNAATDITIQVLSTAAKESFESNATWMAAASTVEVMPLAVADNADNTAVLQHHNGHTANVNIGRTIKKGGYNTLCLPFALTEEQVIAAFGEGCDVQELRDDSKISEEGIEINFNQVSSMEAGKPYLVKTTATEDFTPSCFVNVVLSNTVDAATTTDVDFVGVFSPTDLPAEQDILILGAGNTLSPLSADDREIGGMRGYFVLKTERARTAAKRGAKMVVNSKEGGTDIEASAGCAPQTTKCLQNGQLHIIRNGVHFDVQGKVIK